MTSATHITRNAHQPRGGYIPLDTFEEQAFEDALPFDGDCSIAPGTLGTTVDYLSRALLGFSVKKAFEIALMGARIIGAKEAGYANDLANQLQDAIDSGDLSDEDIRNAVRLARYDAAYRAGVKSHNPNEGAEVDEKTVSDIRTLVRRTVSFFEESGPVVDAGITFEGGYGGNIDSGDADLMTEDTLWDLKTSKDKPGPADTLQLAAYYLLMLRSSQEDFKKIRKLGVYNPRLNKSWTINALDIDEGVMDYVQTEVMGIGKQTERKVDWSKEPSRTVYYVIDWIRDTAENEKDKGTKFERASRYYLKNDPLYAARFSEVWMWKDAPTNNGADIGIDLVAQDAEDGSYWAIQCKCYDETSTLDYKTVSTFFGAQGNNDTYAHNMLISTTENLTPNLDKVLSDWSTVRLFPSEMDQADIDWQAFVEGRETAERTLYEPRPHQELAIADCIKGFEENDRGKLIMACGTGKTLTSLRLTERLVGTGGLVLFLAPSIALVGQSMRSWVNQSKLPMRVAVVCSDEKASAVDGDTWDTSLKDLPYPATTDPEALFAQINGKRLEDGLTVIFSTYQSIQVVADAQKKGLDPFDLIICDEAHRTTGMSESGKAQEEISQFVKVHDNTIVSGKKRLYMTATPRIYGDKAKLQAKADSYEVASMDDESTFGPEFHWLSFGSAVDQGLLTDYRVLALTVSESMVSEVYQRVMHDDGKFEIPDAAKIIGCWKGMLNQGSVTNVGDVIGFVDGDAVPLGEGRPLQNAVAFCSTIAESKRIAEYFEKTVDAYLDYERDEKGVDIPDFRCKIHHVDGTVNAKVRKDELDWIASSFDDLGECRILSNARCLAEGIDVPSLDAVMFLQPKKSQIDIVQAVGRVMRRFEGKQYGYIILPVVVPAGMTPEEILDDNESYAAVWQVLKALRSHDERLDARINALPYDKSESNTGDGNGDGPSGEDGDEGQDNQKTDPLQTTIYNFLSQEFQEGVRAVIVKKCGTKIYWDLWARDIAEIAKRHIERIGEIVRHEPEAKERFETFVRGLRDSLNESITDGQAVEMLAQHVITLPVFEALFGGGFSTSNPVSVAMEDMIEIIRRFELETPEERRELEGLYQSVRMRAEGVKTDAGRQQIIKDLYENFFRYAFKQTSEAMGVVYTPRQVVSYILHFTNRMLQKEFGQTFASKDVHILDPFTGTGTFAVDLIEDDSLIPTEELPYKYAHEIHCNEILLLDYYIATINIETAYHNRVGGEYVPFEGAVLTDTFQMYEAGDPLDMEMFIDNTERVLKQMETPVKVILGNPPYSAGQRSANDENQNERYPTLDTKIAETYVKRSDATNNNGMYNSYIRAFRWASDRIGKAGIVCFVSGSGWLDGQAGSGFRRCLEDEFNAIYIIDLRGNKEFRRLSKEQLLDEGDNIFGSGSKSPIAITLLVKNPDSSEHGIVRYFDLGKRLSREDKLSLLVKLAIEDPSWTILKTDAYGDWLNQRDLSFNEGAPIGLPGCNKPHQKPDGVFCCYSRGLESDRDPWVINSNQQSIGESVRVLLECYNDAIEKSSLSGEKVFFEPDKSRIAWSRALKNRANRGEIITYKNDTIREILYRPFFKQYVYCEKSLIDYPGQQTNFYPDCAENLQIIVTGNGNSAFSCFISNMITDVHLMSGGTQCFPLYWYETDEGIGGMFASSRKTKRHDGITDEALSVFRSAYPAVYAERAKKHGGPQVTKEDVFYYIYGILHSPEYRNRFDSNLSKELPRIPLASDFRAFAEAGRGLADLHLNYESVEMYPLEIVGDEENAGPVVKLKWGKRTDPVTKKKVDDHAVLIYNKNLTFKGIPEAADRYVVNGRTPLEWMIDRYQVKTDKASGIVNDPNEYSDDPMYIINLVKRLVTVSVRTMEIVDSLPALDERPQTANWPFAWGRVERDERGQAERQAEKLAEQIAEAPAPEPKKRKSKTEGMDSLFSLDGSEDAALAELDAAGIEYIDRRDTGGALWVVGGEELGDLLRGLSRFGFGFRYREAGGKATDGKPGWWSK